MFICSINRHVSLHSIVHFFFFFMIMIIIIIIIIDYHRCVMAGAISNLASVQN